MIHYQKKLHSKICYICHVPQCHDKLHDTFVKGSNKACNYPDIIAPVVYAVCHQNKLLSDAGVHFKQKWSDMAQFITWLNSKPIQGEKSNLTGLFSWYYATYCSTTH